MQEIPQSVDSIIKTIESGGFEAFIVGGCVRDMLIGITPSDYDITTNALPTQIKSMFKKTVDTGIKHGTVTVIDDNGNHFEITTYRTENGYDDMRHPKNVAFVSNIRDDLARRDFTVNAMAYNKTQGLIDFFGGQKDLKKGILKAVGDPKTRFSEDALRILRLFRFSSTLGFKIERKTKISALSLCKNLEKISSERVANEILKSLMGKNPNALKPLIKNGGLKFFGINTCKHLEKIGRLQNKETLRFFAFLNLCDCDGPAVIKNLKLSNTFKNYYLKAKTILFLNKKSNDSEIKLALSLAEPEILFDIIDYKTHILGEDISDLSIRTKRIIKSAEPYKISHLKINGNDLKNLGIEDKEIGETLKRLCEIVRENPNFNSKEELIKIINHQ